MELCQTEYASSSPEETFSLGERLAQSLGQGAVVALRGGLGAGKTCLAKGMARGLGINETVTSPTYTIMREYSGRKNGKAMPLYHIDAYRLNSDDDFANTGIADYVGSGITVIEWSERIPHSVPHDAITIEIEITGPESRIFRILSPEAVKI